MLLVTIVVAEEEEKEERERCSFELKCRQQRRNGFESYYALLEKAQWSSSNLKRRNKLQYHSWFQRYLTALIENVKRAVSTLNGVSKAAVCSLLALFQRMYCANDTKLKQHQQQTTEVTCDINCLTWPFEYKF